MERVLILGSPGAGKSTFARRLAERSGLPLIHLDKHFWRPGWVEPAPEEWQRTFFPWTFENRGVPNAGAGAQGEQEDWRMPDPSLPPLDED